MKRLMLVSVVLLVACSQARERQRIDGAIRAVLERVDPTHAAVILADDAELAHVRRIVGSSRTVARYAQFEKEHPGEAVPYNIMFDSARVQGPAILVRVHVQAVSHPPPRTMFCGTSYLFEVTMVRERYILREIEASVC
jgi:hypothetical protein